MTGIVVKGTQMCRQEVSKAQLPRGAKAGRVQLTQGMGWGADTPQTCWNGSSPSFWLPAVLGISWLVDASLQFLSCVLPSMFRVWIVFFL